MNKMVLKDISGELKRIRRQEGLRSYLWARPFLYEEALQKNLYYAWYREKEKVSKEGICSRKTQKFTVAVYLSSEREEKLRDSWVEAVNNDFSKYKAAQQYHKVNYLPVNRLSDVRTKDTGDFTVFWRFGDVCAPNALRELAKLIHERPDVDIIYSDEDRLTKDHTRTDPFFKPDWSPDTFLSFFYIGNLLCVRTALLEQLDLIEYGDMRLQLYDAILKASECTNRILHIPQILYHNREGFREENCPIGEFIFEKETVETAAIKQQALARRGISGWLQWEPQMCMYRPVYKVPEDTPQVDIIIPSKDHFPILSRCVESLIGMTAYKNYRITVVDNGSRPECRKSTEQLVKRANGQYLYQEMEFNFSSMCNIGAQNTEGEYILFLNDDIEVIHPEWLSIMLGQAALPYIGAVGAKLLYPDTRLIQHIGVTNLKIGPAHKLSMETDEKSHYFGRNRMEYDYLAVTGACLLVSRNKFECAGRFDEAMRVRYNDVELCMSLYEHGYYNVVRTDVSLYHHESISRGDDTLDVEKMRELIREREHLYKKHPQFRERDPFYNPNLVDHKTLYQPDYIYGFEKRAERSSCRRFKKQIKPEWINECFRLHIEKIEQKEGYIYLEGWSFIQGSDNSAYKRDILLRECSQDGEILKVSVVPRYRDDVLGQYPAEKNISLSGFVCRIPNDELKKNTSYNIAMLAKAAYSRQILFIASTSEISVS